MIVCLMGATYREGLDAEAERELDGMNEMLYAELRSIPGYLSFHMYTGDREVLGVLRFATREALEAWRDHPVHRSVWRRAPEYYERFWIQNSDVYREYEWQVPSGRTGGSMTDIFVNDGANLVKPAQAGERSDSVR